MPITIGIIGGTGLEDPAIFEDARDVRVTTPYGAPSDALKVGTVRGVRCVLISRHGREHNIYPSGINYRANIWALKEAGVNCIIASNASGSLRADIAPGDFVIPDSFIDRTQKRAQTFYDAGEGHLHGVCHIPSHPAYNEALRQALIETAETLSITHHKHGVILCIEGPRYSSRAESEMFRAWGATVVNMTAVPECILAKELGVPFATIALSTDYDCWKDDPAEQVTVDLVARTLRENAENAKRMFVAAVERIAANEAAFLAEHKAAQALAKASIM